jgi:hypothetical protein
MKMSKIFSRSGASWEASVEAWNAEMALGQQRGPSDATDTRFTAPVWDYCCIGRRGKSVMWVRDFCDESSGVLARLRAQSFAKYANDWAPALRKIECWFVPAVGRPASRKARETGHPHFPQCQHSGAGVILPAGDLGHPPKYANEWGTRIVLATRLRWR